MFVCLSVRLSVTRWYSVKTAKHNVKLIYRQIGTLFAFFHTKRCGSILTGRPPVTGATNARGYEKSLYLRNNRIYGHPHRKPYASFRKVTFSMTLSEPWPRFEGRESRYKTELYWQRQTNMWSIERCHIRRPWTTPTADFKVTLLLCPRLGGIKRWSASVVRLSVRLSVWCRVHRL